MAGVGFREATRRYHRVFWPIMGLYLLCLFGGEILLEYNDPAPLWMKVAVSLAAALPMSALLFVILRYFEETDEYTAKRQYKAFAQAAAVTMTAIFIVGFLQLFDAMASFDVFWFGPAFLMLWGLAYCRQCLAGKTV